MQLKLFLLVIVGFAAFVQATEVRQCKGSNARKLNSNEIIISNCNKGVCKLKRKTHTNVELKFVPEKDLKTLTASVSAEIGGIPFPFIGVDGTSACDNIYLEDGTTKTRCPLKAGVPYVYKTLINVLEIYPKLSLVVHWALSQANKEVVCFEIPAKII